MDLSLIAKAAMISGAIVLGVGIKYMTKSTIEIDIVEEIAEKILDHETGIDVDFKTDTIKNLSK